MALKRWPTTSSKRCKETLIGARDADNSRPADRGGEPSRSAGGASLASYFFAWAWMYSIAWPTV